MTEIQRCQWASGPRAGELEIAYHDSEWCVAEHDDRRIFEMLILEMFQAGLSWRTILTKRPAFRRAFADFDYEQVARFDGKKVAELMGNPDIVRNHRKVEAALVNAQAFLKVQEEYGTFDRYIWQFTDSKTVSHTVDTNHQAPCQDELSRAVSKDLKARSFTFFGPVIAYSFLQSIGIINDHEITCAFRQF